MALLIERDVSVLGDINLSQLYMRVKLHNGPGSVPLVVQTQVYSSKNAYDLNPDTNSFYHERLTLNQSFPYDREVDGTDMLGFAHVKIKELLTTDQMSDVPVLDPSTGEYTYDPSTGELITEEVVSLPKFCMDSSISFVDVSVG